LGKFSPNLVTLLAAEKREGGLSTQNSISPLPSEQGCQIHLGTTYQNGKKYITIPQNIPNAHQTDQMAAK
jgi:hypothetical protein